MAKISTSISIDADVREKALEVLFDVPLNLPNADTRSALQEFRDMKEHPESYKRYSNFEDALKEALADN